MKYARITGTGGYLPERVLTNADIEKIVDTSDAWIVERTGIHSRHIVAPDETTFEMGAHAALHALDMAGITPQSLDLIIVATSTPDQIFPSTACLLQKRIGAKHGGAFDVTAACAGFVYALSIADQFIRSGNVKNALVVGSEAMTRLLDWQDRATCVLFGDGAGAVVLQADNKPGIHSSHLHADGNYKDILFVPNRLPNALANAGGYLQMSGPSVFKIAVQVLEKMVDEILETNYLAKSEIDWLIPHQANIRIIQAMAKKLELPIEKVVITLATHGNTSAASIPLALDVAVRTGRIKPGEKLLLEGLGGGMTWASALITF